MIEIRRPSATQLLLRGAAARLCSCCAAPPPVRDRTDWITSGASTSVRWRPVREVAAAEQASSQQASSTLRLSIGVEGKKVHVRFEAFANVSCVLWMALFREDDLCATTPSASYHAFCELPCPLRAFFI